MSEEMQVFRGDRPTEEAERPAKAPTKPKAKLPPALVLAPVVSSVRLAVSVSAVSLSPKLMAVLVVFRVPAALMAAGAVAVRPPAKVKVSPAPLPNTKLPVFKKVVAVLTSLTLVVVPNNSRL